jgi:hypothetical protein
MGIAYPGLNLQPCYPARRAHAPYCIVTLACLDLPHFITWSHTWHDFREQIFQYKSVFIASTNFVSNISQSKKNSDRSDTVTMYTGKYSARYLVRFQSNLNFLDRLSKNTYFMKTYPVKAELFHANRSTDGQTDGAKYRPTDRQKWRS